MKTTYIFNKDNWSGETASITVKNSQFEFNGHNFTVGPIQTFKDKDGDNKWDYHTIELFWEGRKWADLIRFEHEPQWTFEDGDFYRSHKEPAVLCAIAAANLI